MSELSNTMSEITVTLKGHDDEENSKRFTQKFMVYERYVIDYEDEVILRCVEEAKKSFIGEPEQISVKIDLDLT